MPTLAPASRFSNLERSLEAYITTHIVTGLNLPVIFPRYERLEGVEAGTVSRWGDVAYLGLEPRTEPLNIRDGRISVGRFTLNINLYEFEDHLRRGVAGVTAFSLTELGDSVCELFPQWGGIPIYNYAVVGNPQVDAFVILQQPYPNELPSQPGTGISQINVSVTMQYHARTFL